MQITIRDVAKESGYSITTVSIVLNNAPLAAQIPDATREHIKRVAEEMDYKPNILARSLRTKRSHTVGTIVFDITDPYCTQILRGVEDHLFKQSYISLLTDIQNDYSRFVSYLEMLLEHRVEGLIVLANSLRLEIDCLEILEARSFPIVVVGRKLARDSINSVEVNNATGARLALKHLYDLGHKRIAFIRGPEMLIDSKERWKGISRFAKRAGLKLDPRLIVDIPEDTSSPDLGYRLTEELLSRGVSFTAIVAFDDMTAFGAIRALNHNNLRVPTDCSVVGFDDVATAAFYHPSLTTIQQPLHLLGSTGAEILFEAMGAIGRKAEFKPVYQRLAPKLIVRESTESPGA